MADPQNIVAHSRRGERVVGWRLDADDRDGLLARFAPRYPLTVADHVTLAAKVAADTPLPEALCAQIVGRTDDGQGVEALVVAVEGSTDRPDGGTYHITWSLEPGRRAKESNDVLATCGWTALEQPIPINLRPRLLA